MKTRALLASFVLGLVAAAGINLAAPDYIAAVSKSVQASSSSSALEPVLSFLRFISTIFRDSATSPLGLLVWYTLVGIATPVLLLTALEANRHGSGGLLAWYTFFGVVLQVLGIGVVIPLLWIPAYLVHWRGNASAAQPAGAWALSARQVWLIGSLLLLNLVPILGTYHFGTPELRSTAAIAAAFVPVAVAPLWWLVRRDPGDAAAVDSVHSAADGASAAIAHYNLAAGVGVALWALTLIHVASDSTQLLSDLAVAARNPAASSGIAPNLILAADATGLWLSMILFAGIEDGWGKAGRVLAGSFVVGPGAAVALYLANVRERRIGVGATQSLKKLE